MDIKDDVKTTDELLLGPLDNTINDEKFLQQKIKKLNNDVIDTLIKSPKYLISDVVIDDSPMDMEIDFGTIDKKYESNTRDYVNPGFKFFAVKNNNKLYLLGLYTMKSTFCDSFSLYFMPKASYENMSLLGRVCYHKGINPHQNKLGDKTKIGNYVVHFHKMSEEYYDYCMMNYRDLDYSELVAKMQSPDAQILSDYNENLNIKQLSEYAVDMFNISDQVISVEVNDLNQIVESIKNQIGEIERGN